VDKSASFCDNAPPRRSTESLDENSMSPQIRKRFYITVAVVFALLGLYCVFWVIASADMSFTYCDDGYSLFSPIPRCRTPYVAMIAAGLSFLLAVCSFFLARRASVAVSLNHNV